MKFTIICTIVFLVVIAGFILSAIVGDGGFKRMVTITGIYAVRSDQYPVVCFMDADSNQGGLSCLPLSAINGECKK